jgi:FKBP-type peptidyl-prolyl cis-trans isomerase FkpA
MQISKNIVKHTFVVLGILVLFNSCKKEYESIQSIDDAKIKAYIQQNNIPAVKDPSGYYYQILDPGTGGTLLNKDSVFYNSIVKSLNGTVYYTPAAFITEGEYLGYVTPTVYRNAMYAIKRGGKVRVIVPSYLAFGKNGSGVIPPNEVIITDITVYSETTQWATDDRIIREFLTAKGLTATKDPSRAYYNISQVGTGTVVEPQATLTVKYTGKLLDGTIFDQSGETDLVQPLTALVAGWRKVLVGKAKGTKLRMYVPSDLGYGKRTDVPGIPKNSVLDFEIEIVDVAN